jgi:hypothetical protein
MSTRIPGYKIKDGKVTKDPRRLSVSARLQQRSSKRITVKGKRSQHPL